MSGYNVTCVYKPPKDPYRSDLDGQVFLYTSRIKSLGQRSCGPFLYRDDFKAAWTASAPSWFGKDVHIFKIFTGIHRGSFLYFFSEIYMWRIFTQTEIIYDSYSGNKTVSTCSCTSEYVSFKPAFCINPNGAMLVLTDFIVYYCKIWNWKLTFFIIFICVGIAANAY